MMAAFLAYVNRCELYISTLKYEIIEENLGEVVTLHVVCHEVPLNRGLSRRNKDIIGLKMVDEIMDVDKIAREKAISERAARGIRRIKRNRDVGGKPDVE